LMTLATKCMWNHTAFVLLSGSSHFVRCPQGSSTLYHVAGFPSFLRLNNISFHVNTTFCLSTPLSMDTSCLYLFAVADNTSADTGESLLSILLGIYPEMKLLNHAVFYFKFLWNYPTVFHRGCTILHFTPATCKRSNFSTFSPTMTSFLIFLLVAVLMGMGWSFTMV